MIYNGKEYLPLEEAVQELVRLVEGHYSVDRVIADFGITMVNQPVPDPSYLDGVKGTQWGEAYPVGYRSPYDIYIWTRPTAETTNVNDGTWFNVGPLAIPGPQGPKGEQGEQGERGHSTRWYFGDSVTEVASPMPGDVFMNREGVLFMYEEVQGWGLPIISIRGPQGPQGAQGRQGPQGPQGQQGPRGPIGEALPAIVLLGKLTSVDLLPTPSASYVGRGYVVTTDDINMIYTVFEDESQTGQYSWKIAGTLSGFSIITAGGAVVPQFDADTKLDKITKTGELRVYGVNANGVQTTYKVKSDNIDAYSIAQRSSTGEIRCATPQSDIMAANKKYVDDGLATKLNKRFNSSLDYPCVYQVKENSDEISLRYLVSTLEDKEEVFTRIPFQYSAAQRDQYGCLQVAQPRKGIDAVNRNYAEANYSKKLYRHLCRLQAYGEHEGTTESVYCTFEYICSKPDPVGSGYTYNATELINSIAGTGVNDVTIAVNGVFLGENLSCVTFSRNSFGVTTYNLYGGSNYLEFEDSFIEDSVTPII